jgi:para-nitrobenzyl esterase
MNRRSFLERGAGALVLGTVVGEACANVLAQGVRSTSTAPIVETGAGKIRGRVAEGVHIFKGVPYGASTEGRGRFMPPSKPQPWSGVRDTIELGPRSPQPVRRMVVEMGDTLTGSGPMSEDCLRLNVWTPGTGAGRRPVMVWLHGGGFRTGSGGAAMFDGQALARKHDVVVVTVNHRLNVFGFLYLGDLAADLFPDSANLGMRDIVAALEWVRDNIAAFGGNPGNVTVFGQSGGGGKTSMLTAWPSAVGLFHRAIIQSTLSDTAVRALSREEASRASEALLARLQITPQRAGELQSVSTERLLAALVGGNGPAGEVARDVRPGVAAPLTGDLSLRFTPVIDGRWLPRHPYDPSAPEFSAAIPVLCGSVETESVPYQGVDDPYWTTTEIDAPTLHDRVKRALNTSDAHADQVIALYRKNRPKASNMDLATIVASDNGVLRTSEYTIAERRVALGKAPVYMYYFNWYSPLHEGRVRAMHGIELPFVFDHVDEVTFMVGTGPDRQPLADKVSAAWVAFARTGNPNHRGLPAWKPFNVDDRPTMVFNNECRLVNDPYGEERRALKALRESTGAPA